MIAAAVLVAILLPSSTAGAVALEIQVLALSEAAEPAHIEGMLRLRPAGGASAANHEEMVVPIRRAGALGVDLAEGSLWRVRSEIPGWWAPDVVIAADAGTVDIVLRPTGKLTGEMRPSAETAVPPGEITVDLSASTEARQQTALTATIPCPAREGRWSCEVPAGRYDLRFHAPGWASVFRWDMTVAPGATTAVERLVLSPGASLVGFVEIEGPRVVPVEVQLVPASELGNAGARQDRLDGLAQTSTTDDRGLFQFRDLRPGSYALLASGAGLAPAVHGPFEVLPGREAVLPQPLPMGPPLALDVRVLPPQTAAGAPWIVIARPMQGQAPERKAATDPTGTARLEQLSPGWHHLRLGTARRGESWWSGEVEIHPETPPVEIDLPLVPIEGTVERGGEPVEVGLIFSRRGREIRLHPEDGRFDAVLPEPGQWEVKARLQPHVPFVELDPLDVEPAADGSPVPVEIVVPDTVLRGEVVDAEGQPLRSGNVKSREESPPHRTSHGGFRDGRFELVGLPPGRHWVQSHLGGAAAEATVELREGEVTTVRLVLRPPGRITGILLGAGRPLAGVAVWSIPRRLSLPIRSARTDPDGRFELDVPQGVERLHLVVLPYGFAAGELAVDPLATKEVVLEVPELGGMLLLSGAEAGARLRHDGHDLPLPLFTAWAEMHGSFPRQGPRQGRWELPAMAIGSYELCAAPPAADRCARGTLGPGGTLELDVTPEEEEPTREPAAAAGDATAPTVG